MMTTINIEVVRSFNFFEKTGHSWFRSIADSQMRELAAAELLLMGAYLRMLATVNGCVNTQQASVALVEGRKGLKSFVADRQCNIIFPKAVGHAQELLRIIDAKKPDAAPGTMFETKEITAKDKSDLDIELNVFGSMVWEDSRSAYVVVLEKQRAFDLHTLVESPQTAFDENIWTRLSFFSKREIKESGRCLALERYTASGFHMLRAIESETRDCAILLSRAMPPRRDFGDYIKILGANGADTRLTAVLDNVRSLERNPLAHPEDWLSQDDAINLFCISQAVFSRLINCVESKGLLPPKESR